MRAVAVQCSAVQDGEMMGVCVCVRDSTVQAGRQASKQAEAGWRAGESGGLEAEVVGIAG